MKNNKKIWTAILVLSSIFLFILIMPWLEIWGLNMPFIEIKDPMFNIFGFDIPNEKQIGVMMMSGLLMMLPARVIHLSLIKLSQKKISNRIKDSPFKGEDFTRRMQFVAVVINPMATPGVLNNNVPEFNYILDLTFNSKTVREYLMDMMKLENSDQYHDSWCLLSDFVVYG